MKTAGIWGGVTRRLKNHTPGNFRGGCDPLSWKKLRQRGNVTIPFGWSNPIPFAWGVKNGWAMCFLFTNKMQHALIPFCGGGSLSANKFTWGMSNRSGGAVTNPQSHYPNRCAGGVNAQSATGFIGSSRASTRSTARAFTYTTGSVRCNLFDLPRVYLSIEIFECKTKVAFVPAASHQRGECF